MQKPTERIATHYLKRFSNLPAGKIITTGELERLMAITNLTIRRYRTYNELPFLRNEYNSRFLYSTNEIRNWANELLKERV